MNLSEWKNIYFDELKNQLTTTQLIELQLSIIKWNWVLYFIENYTIVKKNEKLKNILLEYTKKYPTDIFLMFTQDKDWLLLKNDDKDLENFIKNLIFNAIDNSNSSDLTIILEYFTYFKKLSYSNTIIERILNKHWDIVLYFLKLYSKEFNYLNSDLQKMIHIHTINVITKKNILWYYFYEYYQWLPFELEILKILKANQDLKYLGGPYKKFFNNVVNKI